MKTTITLLALLFTAVLKAQYPVGMQSFPKTYDLMVFYSLNNASVSLADSGANAFWDMSSNTLAGDSSITEVLNVSGSFQPTHPSANMMYKKTAYGYTTYEFFNISNSLIKKVGQQNPAPPSSHVYSINFTHHSFPMLYKQAYMENFKFRSQGNVFDSGTYQGTVKTTICGWGRVKVSGNTIYDSCLMVMKITNGTDPKGTPFRFANIEFWSKWYVGPVMSAYQNYYYMSGNFIAAAQTVTYQKNPIKAVQPSSGINEPLTGLMIYPNPAGDQMTVFSPNQSCRVELKDLQGKSMLEGSVEGGIPLYLDLGDLKAGIYFLVLETDAGEISYQKVVVR